MGAGPSPQLLGGRAGSMILITLSPQCRPVSGWCEVWAVGQRLAWIFPLEGLGTAWLLTPGRMVSLNGVNLPRCAEHGLGFDEWDVIGSRIQ
ncbi:hypothetical protein HER10_EVM0000733 [Colletotrichum scovillei]|uniref:uncharacterized protein n=1 Tax=Colletotrichum scovillei TaxID=1209932 RepID=UPI0015C2E4E7|nr:uncharacterized protein HER10_EVM0000733 [Colletotrichum scovillei]KAF4779073.1 hypothetical protein HER10_EVM0000733 [Colletotrichum scovillei]